MNQLEAEIIADWQKVGVRNATPVRDGWLVTLRDGHSCFVPNNESRLVPASSTEPVPATTPTEPAPAMTPLMRSDSKFSSSIRRCESCDDVVSPGTGYLREDDNTGRFDPPAILCGRCSGKREPIEWRRTNDLIRSRRSSETRARSTMFSLPPWDPSEMSPDVSERVRALMAVTKCDCVIELCSFEVIEGGATSWYQVSPYVPAVIDYVCISRGLLVDDFTIGNIRPLFASQAKGLPSELFDYLTFERQIVPEARPDLAGMDPRAQYPQWWGNNVIQNVVYPGIVISATIRNPSPVAKRVSALVLGRLIEA